MPLPDGRPSMLDGVVAIEARGFRFRTNLKRSDWAEVWDKDGNFLFAKSTVKACVEFLEPFGSVK